MAVLNPVSICALPNSTESRKVSSCIFQREAELKSRILEKAFQFINSTTHPDYISFKQQTNFHSEYQQVYIKRRAVFYHLESVIGSLSLSLFLFFSLFILFLYHFDKYFSLKHLPSLKNL